MKIFFDTEFIEDGKTIDLISIGMVKEDGEYLYLVSNEFDASKASQWVKDNVLVHINPCCESYSRAEIAEAILKFIGPDKPEFWAYYADYDWVSLCQLFGTMMDLPKGWPMYCRDLKQLVDQIAPDYRFPKQTTTEHHALYDAGWVKESYFSLWTHMTNQERLERMKQIL